MKYHNYSMNIALFSDSYLPTKSGIVTVVIQLKRILEELGHHVVIVTVGSGKDDKSEDNNVYRVNSIPSPVGDGQYIGIPHKKEVKEFLLKHKIEIIHSHTEFFMGHMSIVVGKELKIPVVATTHTMWEDYYKYYLFMGRLIPRRVIRKVVQQVYKRYYAFINVSKKAHDYFNRSYMLPKIPSAIIPNAIDTKQFISTVVSDEEKDALRESLGIKKDDRVVLYVGRVVEEKRLDELLVIMSRVVKQRENLKMIFVGSGEREEKLRNSVIDDGLEDKIKFTGFVDWKKLHSYYAISDYFVTVSLSEMHSMTILEALSLGLPVVCRRDTSFSDTVFHGENGYFADSDEEMDSYLLKLCDDTETCAKMGQKALEICKNFVLESHGIKTVSFYEEVLSKFPKKVTSAQLQNAVDNSVVIRR